MGHLVLDENYRASRGPVILEEEYNLVRERGKEVGGKRCHIGGLTSCTQASTHIHCLGQQDAILQRDDFDKPAITVLGYTLVI